MSPPTRNSFRKELRSKTSSIPTGWFVGLNQQRVEVFLKKVRKALWVLRGKALAVFGLAFKPGTDDTREAPSMKIVERLLAEGASLRLHDPHAIPILKQSLPEKEGCIKYCD